MRWRGLLLLVANAPNGRAGVGYEYDRDLSWWAAKSLEVASLYTGAKEKRVPYRTYIRCYADAEAFEAPLRGRGLHRAEVKAVVAYYAGQGSINLRSGTCARVRQFVGEKPRITSETASAVSTMLHETLHRQGIRDERITECFANEAVKYAGWLAHWNSLETRDDVTWAASEVAGVRASSLAFAQTARWIATEYRMPKPECLRLTRSFSWAEYRHPS